MKLQSLVLVLFATIGVLAAPEPRRQCRNHNGKPIKCRTVKTVTGPGATVTQTGPGATVTQTGPGATVTERTTETGPGATVTERTTATERTTEIGPGTTETVTQTITADPPTTTCPSENVPRNECDKDASGCQCDPNDGDYFATCGRGQYGNGYYYYCY